jgi:DNA repair exonuclease SbcCD ATPase subunit
MRTLPRIVCLLVVGLSFATNFVHVQAQEPKKKDIRTNLEKLKDRLEALTMLRVAQIMDAEAKGMDIRDNLEKLKDKGAILRWADPKYIASVSRQATVLLGRRADVLEARKKGNDIRTDLEKAEEKPVTGVGFLDAEYDAARKRFLNAIKDRETAIKKAKDDGKDIRSELEKAVETFEATVHQSPDYQAALKRLKAAQGDGLDDPLIHSRSAPYTVARTRLKSALER